MARSQYQPFNMLLVDVNLYSVAQCLRRFSDVRVIFFLVSGKLVVRGNFYGEFEGSKTQDLN